MSGLKDAAALRIEATGAHVDVLGLDFELTAPSRRGPRHHRIEERRTWVLVEQGQLIFKADIISDTPEVVYLEGVYVRPEYRRQGHGSKCLTQLTRGLLNQTRSISLLVNQERQSAQEFFKKLGFVSRGLYDTIFLRTQTEMS
jgi:predicted GNAT family acetyltransferase